MLSHELYTVRGKRIMDSWYCHDGHRYHAFFLEYPAQNAPADYYNYQSIGHSSSPDMRHWEYHGTILSPDKGRWDDKGLATGSVVAHAGRWYILYTGKGSCGRDGLGLAVSDDLYSWRRVSDRPAVDLSKAVRAAYEGTEYDCLMLADPYIYPEPINGWYYAYVNAHAQGRPLNHRGCQVLLRSRDLMDWSAEKIALLDECDRTETAQVWEHGGKWYMYFGQVFTKQEGGQTAFNQIYMAEHFSGPFLPCGKSECQLGQYFYIMKLLQDTQGREVILANSPPDGVIGPFAVRYLAQGGIDVQGFASEAD